VTDLFGRLAARSSGTAAPVEPRMPARFEPYRQAGDDALVETVEQTVPASRTEPSPAGPVPPEPLSTVRPAEVPSGPDQLAREPDRPPAPGPADLATRSSAPVAGPDTRTVRTAPAYDGVLRPAVDTPTRVTSERASTERASPERASSERTAPAPAGPDRATSRPPERSTAASVRISIGRIEIRAPAPAPVHVPTPPPAARTTSGLSLADYLRGDDGRPR
jgi:hypothetical protein